MTEEHIRVFCRIRPMNKRELTQPQNYSALDLSPNDPNTVLNVDVSGQQKSEGGSYTFDRVFVPEDNNDEVFDSSCKDIVSSILDGFNGTIMAYGQTGSGKSYTMGGDNGVIAKAVNHIFEQMRTLKENSNKDFRLSVTYVEFDDRNIIDLLSARKPSRVVGGGKAEERGSKIDVNYKGELCNYTPTDVKCADDVMACLRQGEARRTVASTGMNATSSRTHAVFILNVISSERINVLDESVERSRDSTGGAASSSSSSASTSSSGGGGASSSTAGMALKVLTASLTLIDLAGSEGIAKTGAEGALMKQGIAINSSLLALQEFIRFLSGESGRDNTRETKLNMLLRPLIGGDSRTAIIVNVSPSSFNESETVSTLKFAGRAKTIKSKPKANKTLNTEARLAESEKRVRELEALLAGKGALIPPSSLLQSSSTVVAAPASSSFSAAAAATTTAAATAASSSSSTTSTGSSSLALDTSSSTLLNRSGEAEAEYLAQLQAEIEVARRQKEALERTVLDLKKNAITNFAAAKPRSATARRITLGGDSGSHVHKSLQIYGLESSAAASARRSSGIGGLSSSPGFALFKGAARLGGAGGPGPSPSVGVGTRLPQLLSPVRPARARARAAGSFGGPGSYPDGESSGMSHTSMNEDNESLVLGGEDDYVERPGLHHSGDNSAMAGEYDCEGNNEDEGLSLSTASPKLLAYVKYLEEENERLEGDLTKALDQVEVFASDLESTLAEADETAAALSSLQDEKENLVIELREALARLADLTSVVEEKSETIEALTSDAADMEEQLSQSAAQVELLTANLSSVATALENSHAEATAAIEANQEVARELSVASANVATYKAKAASLESELSTLRGALAEAERNLTTKDEALQELDGLRVELAKARMTAMTSSASAGTRAAELEEALRSSKVEAESLKNQLEAAQATTAELKASLESEQESSAQSRASVTSLSSQLERQTEATAAVQLLHDQAHEQLSALAAQLAAANAEIATRAVTASGMQEALTRALEEKTTFETTALSLKTSLEAALNVALAEKSDLEAALNGALAEKSDLEAALNVALAEKTDLEAALNVALAEKSAAQEALASAEATLKESRESTEKDDEESAVLRQELAQLKGQVVSLEESLESARADGATLAQSHSETLALVATLEDQLKNNEDLSAKDLASARSQVVALEEALASSARSLSDALAKVESLEEAASQSEQCSAQTLAAAEAQAAAALADASALSAQLASGAAALAGAQRDAAASAEEAAALRDRLAEVEEELRVVCEALESESASRAESQAALDEATQALAQARAEAIEAGAALKESLRGDRDVVHLQKEVDKLKERLAASEAGAKELRTARTTAESERQSAIVESRRLADRLAAKEKDCDKLAAALEVKRKALADANVAGAQAAALTKAADKATARAASLETELAALKENALAVAAKSATQESQLDTLCSEVKALRAREADLANALGVAREEAAACVQRERVTQEAAAADAAEASAALATFQARLEEALSALSEREGEKQELSSELAAALADVAALQASLEESEALGGLALKEAHTVSLEREAAAVLALKVAHEGELKALHEALLRAEMNALTATNAVLALEEQRQQMQQQMQQLHQQHSNESGRSGFSPLATIESVAGSAASSSSSSLGFHSSVTPASSQASYSSAVVASASGAGSVGASAAAAGGGVRGGGPSMASSSSTTSAQQLTELHFALEEANMALAEAKAESALLQEALTDSQSENALVQETLTALEAELAECKGALLEVLEANSALETRVADLQAAAAAAAAATATAPTVAAPLLSPSSRQNSNGGLNLSLSGLEVSSVVSEARVRELSVAVGEARAQLEAADEANQQLCAELAAKSEALAGAEAQVQALLALSSSSSSTHPSVVAKKDEVSMRVVSGSETEAALQEKVTHLMSRVQKAEASHAALSEAHTALLAKEERAKADVLKAMGSLRTALATATADLEKMTAAKAVSEQRCTALQAQVTAKDGHVTALTARVSALEGSLARATAETAALSAQFEASEAEVNTLVSAMEETTAELAAANTALTQIPLLEAQLKASQNETEEALNVVGQLSDEKGQLSEALSTARAESKAIQEKLDAALTAPGYRNHERIEQLAGDLHKVTAENTTLKAQVRSLETKVTELRTAPPPSLYSPVVYEEDDRAGALRAHINRLMAELVEVKAECKKVKENYETVTLISADDAKKLSEASAKIAKLTALNDRLSEELRKVGGGGGSSGQPPASIMTTLAAVHKGEPTAKDGSSLATTGDKEKENSVNGLTAVPVAAVTAAQRSRATRVPSRIVKTVDPSSKAAVNREEEDNVDCNTQ